MSASDINNLRQQAVERIWLVPVNADEGGLTLNWCDDPAPSTGMDPAESVEYVRADVHRATLERQARSAQLVINTAKTTSAHKEDRAARLLAESNPGALESEREANAHLTAEMDRLEGEIESLVAEMELLRNAATALCSACEQHQHCFDGSLFIPVDVVAREIAPLLEVIAGRHSISLARRDIINKATGVSWAATRAKGHPNPEQLGDELAALAAQLRQQADEAEGAL